MIKHPGGLCKRHKIPEEILTASQTEGKITDMNVSGKG